MHPKQHALSVLNLCLSVTSPFGPATTTPAGSTSRRPFPWSCPTTWLASPSRAPTPAASFATLTLSSSCAGTKPQRGTRFSGDTHISRRAAASHGCLVMITLRAYALPSAAATTSCLICTPTLQLQLKIGLISCIRYTLFHDSSLTGAPIARPLYYEFPYASLPLASTLFFGIH